MHLFKNIQKYKGNVALISESEGEIKYSNILNYEKSLRKIIKKRSLVLIICENSVASIVSYIFSVRNNCVPILIDSKTSEEEVINIINLYCPDYISLPEKFYHDLNLINYKLVDKFFNFMIFFYSNQKQQTFLHENLALLLTTSGSMGSPKLVRISNENLFSNTRSIINYLNISEIDRAITTMPMSYTYMLSIINSHIETGASIIVNDNPLISREFWKLYNSFKPTSFSGVPFIYEIINKIGVNKIDNPKLKIITQAGGKLKEELVKKFSDYCINNRIRFFIMYGQTEATSRMSYLEPSEVTKRLGSIGKPISGSKMWLIDEDENIIKETGKNGELVYKGDNVSYGYSYSSSDLSKDDENNKILYTGDIANFDKDGFFYISGRLKRIAKIYGNRFNLDEIEQKMDKRGFKIICKDGDDKLLVFYDNDYSKIKLLDSLSEITKQNKNAFDPIQINEIPRTIAGKIDFVSLKKNEDD